MSRVTVLMSVYNGEKYLAEAVDSVLGQTLSDIQLICIDDASTDSTPDMLARYAEADRRVKVITHQENTGQAVARNDGIRIADGDYITMVDADDWLSADALELAVRSLDSDAETGAVLLDLVYHYPDRTEEYPMRSDKQSWSGKEAMELSLDWSVHGLYVARTELFRRYPYDDTCRLYSDDNTTRLHYLHAGRVGRCGGVYHYRQHDGSMTNSISLRRYDILEANSSMSHTLRAENLEKDILSRFERERWINLTGICIYWMKNDGMRMTAAENGEILRRIRTAYEDVDRSLLPKRLTLKFGYRVCRSFDSWLRQVRAYHKMRVLLKRDR